MQLKAENGGEDEERHAKRAKLMHGDAAFVSNGIAMDSLNGRRKRSL